MTTVVIVLLALGCVAAGFVLHAYLAKHNPLMANTSKDEISAWAIELRATLATDAEAAKDKVRALILKLEAKL